MNIAKILSIMLVGIILNGCTTTTVVAPDYTVTLSEQVNYTLTVPPKTLVGKHYTHFVEINFADKQKSFIAQVEYFVGKITVVAMSPSGIPLFDFQWHIDKPAIINQYVTLPDFDLNYIIADMQWINWPIESLVNAVVGEQVDVLEKATTSGNWSRSVIANGKLILKVDKSGPHFHLSYIQRKYTIDITDLTQEDK